MARKPKVSLNIKIKAVKEFLSGDYSKTYLGKKYNVDCKTISLWLSKYEKYGEAGLRTTSHNKSYPTELRLSAISTYQKGGKSLLEICTEFNINSTHTLHQWILKYNGHKELNIRRHRRENLMTKGRKTTYKERIEIVAFCISQNNNYEATIQKYNVSYQQIYSWVKKYESLGEKALDFHQGRKLTKDISSAELSEEEKYKSKIKLLEAENKKLQMENDILKKFQEIERR